MRQDVDVSYVTTLPIEGNAPRVLVKGDPSEQFTVKFYDGKELLSEVNCRGGEEVFGRRQWFTNWRIKVYDSDGDLYSEDRFDTEGKVIFIKMDAYALGDTIAWIPYVEQFRDNHNCTVICSTFHNDILINAYPDILFVAPDTPIHNVYAQYYIGAHEGDSVYSPIDVNEQPLQKMSSTLLGMEHSEMIPRLDSQFANHESRFEGKYVCISEHGSGPNKRWRAEGGWQQVVNFLNVQGYKVVVISKEPTQLNNVIDLTGNYDLKERMMDLMYCEFYMGVSSGLAWLAWGMQKHVFMISDCTPVWHEFEKNCTRISENNLSKVDYTIDTYTSPKKVIESLVVWGVS